MNISKTTHNFAEKRGMDVYLDDDGRVSISVCSAEGEIDSASAVYLVDEENGGLYFVACYEKQIEDLPAYIFSEKQLRDVVLFISKETNIVW